MSDAKSVGIENLAASSSFAMITITNTVVRGISASTGVRRLRDTNKEKRYRE